ncbi:protein-glutamate O-methyltransferase family protein [Candidatus Bathyarchaeota archaeon]|nr:protein-glutamate O-methyltransferase family protein [Candidatus Bathyarchaeota archaeon]
MGSQEKLPDFLMTSEPGSFAQKTILYRKPRIIEGVINDNDYPLLIVKRLIRFKEEILSGAIQPLTEDAPDVEEWNNLWLKFKGRTWLELPWYFAEAYFYRRLLEAVEYFQPGPLKNHDPFQKLKRKQLKESLPILDLAMRVLNNIRDLKLCFENLLHASLWGNRVDLSNLTVTDDVRRRQAMIERENLLINDFPKILKAFEEEPLSQIAFVNDNVGVELGFDLLLADFLLRNNWADKIIFYLKPYPFFVSDAMPKDLQETIKAFIKTSNPNLSDLGKRIEKALAEGIISTSADWFWASPYHFCEMPSSLYTELSRFDLVILKGDVNYRRLLSDRHWPYTTPIRKIVYYFPTSILILRTLKGEIIVDLKEGEAEKLEAEDPDWLINGKRGIIQFIKHSELLKERMLQKSL